MAANSILVVDDCDLSQMIAQHAIASFDPQAEVHEAYDGQEALEKLRALPRAPDLIFLDINMPRMNGHEFLAAYAAETDNPCTVAMMSSSDLPADVERATQYPFVRHYFAKPFTSEHLAQASATLH